jgi:hypothetical protein
MLPQNPTNDEFTPEQLEQFKSCLSTMFKVYYKGHQYDRNGEAYFDGHSDTRGPSWYSMFAVGTFRVRTDQQNLVLWLAAASVVVLWLDIPRSGVLM